MEIYVNLSQENILTLYHYCVEISDAIRPFLNGVPTDKANQQYFFEKLNEFKNVIDAILKIKSKSSDLNENIEIVTMPDDVAEEFFREFPE